MHDPLIYIGRVTKPATGHTFRRWRFTRDALSIAGARRGDTLERCVTCADRGEPVPFVVRPRVGRPFALVHHVPPAKEAAHV